MKVLYLINYAGKAGTEKYVENLMDYLHPGHCQCGLCYNLEGPLADKTRDKGMAVHRVVMKHPFDLKAAREIAKLCKEEGYEVIHAQYPRENCVALLSRLFGSRAKVVFTSHLTIHQPLFWRVLNRLFTPQNQKVLAVCKASEEILRDNGVKADRIQVIFNGIDAAQMPPRDRGALAEFGIGGQVVLITLARFMPEKGLGFLCDGVKLLKARTSVPFQVLLVGDGEEFDAISQKVRDLGLEDTVKLPGFRSDTGRLLAASDIYLNTSEAEAMSFAILEAMANGLPVVATDVGGNRDLVHVDGESGLTVPYGDPEAFAAALQTLLEQPELRKTMGQTALKKAKTTFDLNKLLEDVYHTYQ